MTTPDSITRARAAFIDARLDLADAIREACPAGSSHAYVQRRDRQPAWCEACGFAEDGTRIKDLRGCWHGEECAGSGPDCAPE